MQDLLVNPRIKDKIITLKDYEKLSKPFEFILYSDNILEGISLLNSLTLNDDLLAFYGVVYEPYDSPIYIFRESDNFYAIKICGHYDKWNLPNDVSFIKSFVDLPDYIFYSIQHSKVILAGENTETASVGNSQWQREGRKIAAAKLRVPFIYQTFYSGKDESLDTIREPNALQAYNAILYSARYKSPNLIAYFENNFHGSTTRIRNPIDSQELFIKYIKVVLLSSVNSQFLNTKIGLEKEFFKHMIGYLKEGKYSDKKRAVSNEPRIISDLPIMTNNIRQGILRDSENFVNGLVDYIYNNNNKFAVQFDVSNFEFDKLREWTFYKSYQYLGNLLAFLKLNDNVAKSYTSRAKIGFVDSKLTAKFLGNKFQHKKAEIESVLTSKSSLLLPLRIHKNSNGKLIFSPDPESGEIVAYSELFGYGLGGQKRYKIIGYCFVDTPSDFDFAKKMDTKIYKAIANYIDILILNDKEVITSFEISPPIQNNYYLYNLNIAPKNINEEVAIVSTYLNQSTIKADWNLCFIHTHHSSWQQITINNEQEKIPRVSTKLDLIMQDKNVFMLAEGKNQYNEILKDGKIKSAMKNSSAIINQMYDGENLQFDALIFNLPTTPSKDPEYYADCKVSAILGAIKRGHFNDIVFHKDFVIIIVYLDSHNHTKFKLVFSNDFDENLRDKLTKEFL
ncbi:TPA: hypothetical protein R1X71_000652 [Campylobacter upsaliensis]|nr:hypothetical protein [Campylobacter upsaliensis]